MTSLLDPLRGVAADLATPILRAVGAAPARRTAPGHERSHLEVRGMHRDEAVETRRLVEKQLTALPGVRGAAVNAVLGRVVVDHDASIDVADLLAVIDEVEQAHEVAGSGSVGGHHPADGTARHRQLVALGVDVTGFGVVLAERALVPVPITAGLVPPALTAVLSLAESVPALRALAERAAGPSAAESWFSIGSAGAQALGRGPLGLVTDACYRWLRAREAGARHAAWRELDVLVDLDAHRVDAGAAHTTTRGAALRYGSVQHVGDAAGAGALSGMALVSAMLPERATAVALAGAPKAARWGWEAFAAAAGYALADRRVVVLDPSALRRADRVDVVVLDPGLPERVFEAAAAVGRVVVAAPEVEALTELQAEGHGVAVVTADPGAADALAAADVAVFVGTADEGPAPVWTADLFCADADAALAVLAVLEAAPAAARRSAALAVLASCAALPIALMLPVPGLNRWASLPVTSGALLSLGVGTWTGANAVPPAA